MDAENDRNKSCPRCCRTLPRTTEFFVKGKLKGGIGSWCKRCFSGYSNDKQKSKRVRADKIRIGAAGYERVCARCGEWRELHSFEKRGDAKLGYGGHCTPCRRQWQSEHGYQMRRATGQVVDKPFWQNWSSEWLELDAKVIRGIKIGARKICAHYGQHWMADDVEQHALILAHQRDPDTGKNKRVSLYLVFWHLFDHEFGERNSAKRKATLNGVSFEDVKGILS